MLTTPVAFFVFNRPQLTERVFAEIASAKPARLLIVADGPRNEIEAEKCLAVRAIVEKVDWECEVLTNFSEVNLGCKLRVSSGLDWVFEHCEEAIILEDDCLPDQSFFSYCAELLERFRDDERVMMIGGSNFISEQWQSPYSYYYVHCYCIWGWASWRRAWKYYDVDMKLWPLMRNNPWLKDFMGDNYIAQRCREIWEDTYLGKINTWDFQWGFAMSIQSGLGILPAVNLISNIGFGNDATNTVSADNPTSNLAVTAMDFPLHHPPYMVREVEADAYTGKKMLGSPVLELSMLCKIRKRLSESIPRPIKSLKARLFGAVNKIPY